MDFKKPPSLRPLEGLLLVIWTFLEALKVRYYLAGLISPPENFLLVINWKIYLLKKPDKRPEPFFKTSDKSTSPSPHRPMLSPESLSSVVAF